MQEHRITVAGTTFVLEEPFFVLATQNPIEQEGTYPLPEAQLDRFMFNLWIDYPSFDEEVQIVKSTTSSYAAKIEKILTAQDLIAYQDLVRRVPVADNVVEYAVRLATRTRPTSPSSPDYCKKWLRWGAGPRASQYLILGAKAHAVIRGAFSPEIADVRSVAHSVLRHRLLTSFHAEAEGVSSVQIIDRLLGESD
jgi:MoxR-like ATPase